MLQGLSLRARIFVLLGLLVLANVGGALVTLWYIRGTQALHAEMFDLDVAALVAAQDVEAELVIQKGYTTYFILDGKTDWLDQLEKHQAAFSGAMARARRTAYSQEAKEILNSIESAYLGYSFERAQVIDLFKAGKREEGAARHLEVRGRFRKIYDLCEQYKHLHQQSLGQHREDFNTKARYLAYTSLAAIPFSAVLGFFLAFVMYNQVLEPIARLALAADQAGGEAGRGQNEVSALNTRVRTLIADAQEAQTQLEQSQSYLMQSEKLAVVGKLSASVAHSIRNPLTSLKMRLFSLERSLVLDTVQKEDFEVIAEEIAHIDTIVGNFLEFARPPRLRMQRTSPSEAVDNAVQLLRHRLESYGVTVKLHRVKKLPRTAVDPEQLKEVLVNLILNACDAMGDGGSIYIYEEEDAGAGPGSVTIRVADTGPGIPANIMDKIFEPFFSSKEEGSGLGLAIARRVMEEHGGSIAAQNIPGAGAMFKLTLPVKEEHGGNHTRC
jgi:signal transduction histidine kinase